MRTTKKEHRYSEWHAKAVENELALVEKSARESSDFLRDAPAGSSNLREAMLVHAIRAVKLQFDGVCRDSSVAKPPVVTTGLDVAVAVAVKIAEAA